MDQPLPAPQQPQKQQLNMPLLALGLFVLVLIVIWIIIFSFWSGLKKPSENAQAPKQVVPTFASTVQGYNNGSTHIEYPSDWTVAESSGSAVFMPKDAALAPYYFHLLVSKQSTRIEELTAFLSQLGLTETFTTVQGIRSEKFSGTMQIRTGSHGEAIKKPYQQTTILVPRGQEVVVIEYTYDRARQNQTYEQLFQGMIDTVKLD